MRESLEVDGGHAVGNSHKGQTAATIESKHINICHTVRDGHRGQTAAT